MPLTNTYAIAMIKKESMKRFFLLTILLFSIFLAVPHLMFAQQPTLTYGSEETVYDSPINYFPDLKYFTYIHNNTLYGVLPGSTTYFTLDPLASSLTALIPMTNMSPGASIDSAGSWLQGLYVQSSALIHGYYHSEDASLDIPDDWNNQKSISYAVSDDGGASWTKPDYPNNQIITKDPTVTGSYAGDPDVKVFGNYLYIIYGSGNGTLSLARSSLADAGKPGTRFKYYCPTWQTCDFTEPGLGGKSTPVLDHGFDPFFSFNTDLNKYLLIDSADIQGWDGVDYQHPKLNFMISDDLIHWTPLFQTSPEITPPPDAWQYFYPSIISLDGNSSQSGQQFWLYYTRRQPSDWRKRYLLRRQITLSAAASSPSPAPCLAADINRDGTVNIMDRTLLMLNFFQTNPTNPRADINTDGIVDVTDYSILVKNFGATGVCL